MRTTIRRVAEEAGVSAVTVSNVLRGVESRASHETRARVLKAARELNYLPVKPPTVQNRHVETRIVTLVPEHHDLTRYELDLQTYEGVVEGARQHGYDVLTMINHDRNRGLEREELRYLDRRSDGFIFAISTQGQWENALDVVAQHQVPTVVCYRSEVPHGVVSVDVDNASAMRQCVQHLVAQGHRRIGYLSGPKKNFDERQRQRGWRQAMREHGLAFSDRAIVLGTAGDYSLEPGAVSAVLAADLTAVVCFDDTLALQLWDALEARGVRVPHDVSLLGMDNRPEAAAKGLSSIAFSFSDVGRLAMEAWVQRVNGAEAADCCRAAPVHLVVRQSVRTRSDAPTGSDAPI